MKSKRTKKAVNIFSSWNNFEVALKEALGLVNEERHAAA
jgi:hypothetical protein